MIKDYHLPPIKINDKIPTDYRKHKITLQFSSARKPARSTTLQQGRQVPFLPGLPTQAPTGQFLSLSGTS